MLKTTNNQETGYEGVTLGSVTIIGHRGDGVDIPKANFIPVRVNIGKAIINLKNDNWLNYELVILHIPQKKALAVILAENNLKNILVSYEETYNNVSDCEQFLQWCSQRKIRTEREKLFNAIMSAFP